MAPRAPSKKEKEKEKEATPARSPSILSVASNTPLSSVAEAGKDVMSSPSKARSEEAKVKKSRAGAGEKRGAKKGEKGVSAAAVEGLENGEEMQGLEGGNGNDEGMKELSGSGTGPATATDILKPKTEDAKIKKSKPASEKSKVTKAKLEKGLAASEKAKVVKAGKEKKDMGGGSKEKVEKGKEKAEKGKEKVEKVSGEEAEKLILLYLKEQNRPYSATEISANLHGKVTKTLADKLLKEMEQNGQLQAKATNGDKKGSQWVFWYPQDPSSTASPSELAAYESTIQTLTTTTIPPLKSTLKTLTATLSTILSTPSTPALAILVEELRIGIAEKTLRLQDLKGGDPSLDGLGGKSAVKKEEAEKIEKEWKYWKDALGRRKRCWKEVEGQLLEGMGREELWERVGIEVGEGDELWLK
ncbi:hypothetical protein HYFRA_00013572 [Hymenoscyphus fraxineus]|uniref:Homologous-pairing protein 2 winged helix domain-containing protein n=1 Tax=Hymenoscyphus fraxineus TaxID=746836 RepID=A0A9N9LBU5_9HELO|nr:hypothetical protein HYFRA_00013572 [Hymenoscyphus fraxineus]